jgi:hypothetical protein
MSSDETSSSLPSAPEIKAEALELKDEAKAEAIEIKDKAKAEAIEIKDEAKATIEAAVDKIADAAPRVDPRELKPRSALDGLKKVDQTLLRLNKYDTHVALPRHSPAQANPHARLLASPGGLSAFLSTFNYTLYILAYLQSKSTTLSAVATTILDFIRPACNDAKIASTPLLAAAGVPPVAALAVLISKARTTLRLFGLFPLYAWLRTLVRGPKADADAVLHRIALLQASSYFTYQALENVGLLADSGVISPVTIARINRGDPTTARLYTWAYRAWLGGVSCDFLRLAREWQVEGKRRSVRKQMQSEGRALAEYQDVEDAKFDKKWWTEAMIASAWLPMALHFSSATGGVPGWNLGWMGLCGLVAGGGRMKALWAGTA